MRVDSFPGEILSVIVVSRNGGTSHCSTVADREQQGINFRVRGARLGARSSTTTSGRRHDNGPVSLFLEISHLDRRSDEAQVIDHRRPRGHSGRSISPTQLGRHGPPTTAYDRIDQHGREKVRETEPQRSLCKSPGPSADHPPAGARVSQLLSRPLVGGGFQPDRSIPLSSPPFPRIFIH